MEAFLDKYVFIFDTPYPYIHTVNLAICSLAAVRFGNGRLVAGAAVLIASFITTIFAQQHFGTEAPIAIYILQDGVVLALFLYLARTNAATAEYTGDKSQKWISVEIFLFMSILIIHAAYFFVGLVEFGRSFQVMMAYLWAYGILFFIATITITWAALYEPAKNLIKKYRTWRIMREFGVARVRMEKD